MPRQSAGKGLILGGVIGIVALVVGWPLLDRAVPCGFLDASCALGRFFMFWIFLLLTVAAAAVGLLVMAFGAKEGRELARSGGAAGLSYGKRGGAYVLGRSRSFRERGGRRLLRSEMETGLRTGSGRR